jgi:hypothetical protein
MFVIYHIASTMQVGPYHGHPHTSMAKSYKTFGAALNTARKWNVKAMGEKQGPGPYGVASVEHYRSRVVRMVTKTNLLSGKTYTEASNTPGFMSPSSEAYWSM